MPASGVIGVFAFLVVRGGKNAALRQMKRLREPRYLIGSLFGAAYFYFYFGRWLLPGRNSVRFSRVATVLPAEVLPLVLTAASLLFALFTLVAWLLWTTPPRLSLSEADVQFLLPAPLPPRAVLHFSLLRSQLSLAFSALILGLVFGRGISPHGWQRVCSSWIVLSAMHLHGLGLAFSRARGDELPGWWGRFRKLASSGLAIVLLAILLAWLVDGLRLLAPILMSGPRVSLEGVAAALSGWNAGVVPGVLLAPFRALLAPAFRADPVAFLWSLPAALTVVLFLYAWVVRVSVRYEEAALEGARRRAERAARFRRGRAAALPSERGREVVPFRLRSEGSPELAVVWKNLLSLGRRRLLSTFGAVALLWALVFVAASLAAGSPGSRGFVLPLSATAAMFACPLALLLPVAIRNDFRSDLEHASMLRAWPLAPQRLVVAELLGPLIVAVSWIWGLLGASVAAAAGSWLVLGPRSVPLTMRGDVRFQTPLSGELAIPAVLGLALFLPALSAGVLVVQNGIALAFPAWFPPGPRRARGFEATGTRLLTLLGTLLVVVFALIPAGLVAAPVAWLGWKVVGAWALPPAGIGAAAAVLAEAVAATSLLGRLFAAFDVSKEELG